MQLKFNPAGEKHISCSNNQKVNLQNQNLQSPNTLILPTSNQTYKLVNLLFFFFRKLKYLFFSSKADEIIFLSFQFGPCVVIYEFGQVNKS
jgi:hypothetical protein